MTPTVANPIDCLRQQAEVHVCVEHELAESRAAQAVEAERRSIAHDLHDVIAGHLSAVALHSSLAASLEDRSEIAAAKIRNIRLGQVHG